MPSTKLWTCSNLAIVSVSFSPHSQVRSLKPSSASVASLTTTHSPYAWVWVSSLAFTVILNSPLTAVSAFAVAVIVTVPSLTPFTVPPSTVAIALSLDSQVTDLSSASDGETVTSSLIVAPTSTSLAPLISTFVGLTGSFVHPTKTNPKARTSKNDRIFFMFSSYINW